MRYLTIDGMLSGTGVRDSVNGEYIKHEKLGLSSELSERITRWLTKYETSHYHQFGEEDEVKSLDAEGIEICRQLHGEVTDSKITYFSAAKMSGVALGIEA